MEMDPVPGYSFANWERGYGDFHLEPDLRTLRRITWLDRSALVLCDLRDVSSHDLVEQAPAHAAPPSSRSRRRGGVLRAGRLELEFYVFAGSYRDAASRRWQSLQPAGWYLEDYHLLQGRGTSR
jgi:glutamine synthetase